MSLNYKLFCGETKDEKIWIMNTDGTNPKVLTYGSYPSLTSDAKYLLFHRNIGPNDYDIFKYQIDTGVITNLTRSTGFDVCPKIINQN